MGTELSTQQVATATRKSTDFSGNRLRVTIDNVPRNLMLTRRLATGGFGAAYAAVDEASNATLCVKIPHDPNDDSVRVEAKFAARVKGYEQYAPRVVSAEYERSSGWLFFKTKTTEALSTVALMPFAPHGTLKDLCEEHQLTGDNIDDCVRMIVDNLMAVHAAGIIHRDISPDNVLVFDATSADAGSSSSSSSSGAAAAPGRATGSSKRGVQSFRLVIADYGVAIESLSPSTQLAGKALFMAPEMTSAAKSGQLGVLSQTRLVDWYSTAITLQFVALWVYDKRASRPSDLDAALNTMTADQVLEAWAASSRLLQVTVAAGSLPNPLARLLALALWVGLPSLVNRFLSVGIIAATLALSWQWRWSVYPLAIFCGLLEMRTTRANAVALVCPLVVAFFTFDRPELALACCLLLPVKNWPLFCRAWEWRQRPATGRVAAFPTSRQPPVTIVNGRNVSPAAGGSSCAAGGPSDVFTAKCVKCRTTFTDPPSNWACPACQSLVWQPDNASNSCVRCKAKFALTTRRHHCRDCGFLVCAACLAPEKCQVPHRCSEGTWSVCRLCAMK